VDLLMIWWGLDLSWTVVNEVVPHFLASWLVPLSTGNCQPLGPPVKSLKPMPDTLSFYTFFMSHHIKPTSVNMHLSSICQQVEIYFPNVQNARKSVLVYQTLNSCKYLLRSPTGHKSVLTHNHLLQTTNPDLFWQLPWPQQQIIHHTNIHWLPCLDETRQALLAR